MPRANTLNSKQRAFLAEYLKDHNGTRAATAAGYSPGSARAIAGQLLAKPHIRAELARLETELLDRNGVTADQVLRQIQRIAFFDIATIYKKTNVSVGHQYKCLECGYSEFVESLGKVSGSHGTTAGCRNTLTVTELFEERRVMLHPSEWPEQARPALASMETVIRNLTAGDGMVDTVLKVKTEPKIKALELLANHFGLTKEVQTEVNNTIVMQWLPPEPPPAKAVDGVRLDRVPGLPSDVIDLEPAAPEKMGSRVAPPTPNNRTHAPRFSGPGGEDTAEFDLVKESEAQVLAGGMSRRARERMLPELRADKPRV